MLKEKIIYFLNDNLLIKYIINHNKAYKMREKMRSG